LKRGESVSKGKIELKDVILTLWGVALAFSVQVLYDSFSSSSFTSIMPRVWWGIAITVALALLLRWLTYMKDHPSKNRNL